MSTVCAVASKSYVLEKKYNTKAEIVKLIKCLDIFFNINSRYMTWHLVIDASLKNCHNIFQFKLYTTLGNWRVVNPVKNCRLYFQEIRRQLLIYGESRYSFEIEKNLKVIERMWVKSCKNLPKIRQNIAQFA